MGGCSKNQLLPGFSYASFEQRAIKINLSDTHYISNKANVPIFVPVGKSGSSSKNISPPFPELPAGQPGRHPAPEPPIRRPRFQAGGDPGGGGGRGQGVGGQGGGAAAVRQEINRL